MQDNNLLYFLLNKLLIVKFYFCKLLIHFPISSKLIGPPKKLITNSYFSLLNKKSEGDKIIFVKFNGVIYLSLPKTIEQKIHPVFKMDKKVKLPINFVVNLKNGRVISNKNWVISQNDEFLADLSRDGWNNPKNRLSKNLIDHPIFFKIKLLKLIHKTGRIAVIKSPVDYGYFHWMLDVLPKIKLIKDSKVDIDYYLISNELSFQKESLFELGIDESQILFEKDSQIEADELIVPSYPGYSNYFPDWVYSFLRELFLTKNKKLKKYEKIFISREKASQRKILNEADVFDFFKQKGFVKVFLEDYSIKEQARIFNSAKFIVGPHGAGFTNIVFCEAGTKILELFSKKHVFNFYHTISCQQKIDYYYILGDENNNYSNNYLIDLIKLEKISKKMGL